MTGKKFPFISKLMKSSKKIVKSHFVSSRAVDNVLSLQDKQRTEAIRRTLIPALCLRAVKSPLCYVRTCFLLQGSSFEENRFFVCIFGTFFQSVQMLSACGSLSTSAPSGSPLGADIHTQYV